MGDEEMTGDAVLPQDAQHHAQDPGPAMAGGLFRPDPSWSPYEMKQALQERLSRVGIDIYALEDERWCPHEQRDPDYATNHRALLRFWGVSLSKTLTEQDIQTRYRRAARLVHPDKCTGLPVAVQEMTAAIMKALNDSLPELQWRAERVRRGRAQPTVSDKLLQFQEVHEHLQHWLKSPEGGNMDHVATNVSEIMWYHVGAQCRPPWSPTVTVSQVFFDRFLAEGEGTSLWDLLLQTFGVVLEDLPKDRPWRVGVAVHRAPRSLTDWLDGELTRIRRAGRLLDLTIMLMADPYPAPWSRMLAYFGHGLSNVRNLKEFRIGFTYLEPPVMTYIAAGLGSLMVMKKVFLVHLSTGPRPVVNSYHGLTSEHKRWQVDLLPDFAASARLYVDHAAADDVKMHAYLKPVVEEFGGVVARQVPRSFGDISWNKRRTLLALFPPGSEGNDDLVSRIGERMDTGDLVALVGWESVFAVPDDAYVVSSKSLRWLNTPIVKEMVAQGVVVSQRRCVITPQDGLLRNDLVALMENWNLHNDSDAFTELADSEGRRCWQRPEERRIGAGRPQGCPPPHETDVVVSLEGVNPNRMREFVNIFMDGICQMLTSQGYGDWGEAQVWPQKDRHGRVSPSILITGFTMPPVRSLVYTFRYYIWVSRAGGERVVVRMSNKAIEDELENAALRMRAGLPKPLTQQESVHISQHGVLPPESIAAFGGQLALPGLPHHGAAGQAAAAAAAAAPPGAGHAQGGQPRGGENAAAAAGPGEATAVSADPPPPPAAVAGVSQGPTQLTRQQGSQEDSDI